MNDSNITVSLAEHRLHLVYNILTSANVSLLYSELFKERLKRDLASILAAFLPPLLKADTTVYFAFMTIYDNIVNHIFLLTLRIFALNIFCLQPTR